MPEKKVGPKPHLKITPTQPSPLEGEGKGEGEFMIIVP
jgi:hypothetical protein